MLQILSTGSKIPMEVYIDSYLGISTWGSISEIPSLQSSEYTEEEPCSIGRNAGFEDNLSDLLLQQDVSDWSCTPAEQQKLQSGRYALNGDIAMKIKRVMVVGSFLYDPSEYTFHCMFGYTEVPLEIIQEGIISCQSPPHRPGKVTFCITSGNRKTCSKLEYLIIGLRLGVIHFSQYYLCL